MTNILFYLTTILIIITFKWSYIYETIRTNKIAIGLLIFWLLFTIGVFYTEATYLEAITRWKKHAKFLIAPFFFCLFRNKKLALYAIYGFIAAMLLTCSLGYLKYYGLISFKQHLAGPTSVFKSHIQTNFLLAYTAFLLLVLSNYFIRFRSILIILFLFVTYNTMYLGTGRTGMVIFLVLVFFYALKTFSFRKIILSSVVILLLPVLLFNISNSFHKRVITIKNDIKSYQNDNPNTSVGLRISYFINGVKIILTNPLYGSGTGSVPSQFQRIEKQEILQTNNPHNEYINTGIQIGIIGLAYLLFMFSIQLYHSRKLPFPINYACQGLLISIIVGCTANSLLMDTTEGHFYAYYISAFFFNRRDDNNIKQFSSIINRNF
ncbi:MAG: O-antigen ligase family protein [Legionellales bacterium]|nr:O-antigen ligase family protein [Legionellales bacterium]